MIAVIHTGGRVREKLERVEKFKASICLKNMIALW